jgi:hypothetical protein
VPTVRVNDPDLVEDLMKLLRDSGCIVTRTSAGSFDIRSGWPVRDDAAGYELDGYLRVYEAMHPGVRVARMR